MKYLALAVLLAVMQASPPVPRKTANTPGSSSQNVTQDTESNQGTTETHSAIPQHATQNQEEGHAPSDTDAKETIVITEAAPVAITGPDWWYRTYVIFTGALVVIGGVGVGYAIKTLNAIKRQAKANEDQLTEIQQSAEKTDRMIDLMAQQVEDGRIATQNAKISAEAAERTAHAVINSERALLIVEGVDLIHLLGDPEGEMAVTFRCKSRNFGKGPATITSIACKLEVRAKRDASDAPLNQDIYSEPGRPFDPRLIPPRRSFVFDQNDSLLLTPIQSKAVFKGVPFEFMFAHGIIRYTDASGIAHWTRFNYRYDSSYFALNQIKGFFFSEGPVGWNAWK